VAVLGVAVVPALVRAQRLDVSHYQPAPGGGELGVVQDAVALAPWTWAASMHAVWAVDPVRIVDSAGRRGGRVVAERVELVAAVALGIDVPPLRTTGVLRALDVAAVVPALVFQHRRSALAGGVPVAIDRAETGFGDPRVQARLTLPLPPGWGVELALIPAVSFPLAAGAPFTGDPSVVYTQQVAAAWRGGPLLVAVNAGVRLREEPVAGPLRVPSQLLWSAGVAVELGGGALLRGVSVATELIGLCALSRPFLDEAQTPVELSFSVRASLGPLRLSLAAGPGLTAAYGSPAVRLVLGAAWLPALGQSGRIGRRRASP
jgi:hypothetical protein